MHKILRYCQSVLSEFGQALLTRKFWVELFMMTVGMIFGAAAVYYFLMPSHLVVGSISGLSIVINTAIGGNADTLSYIIMGINAVLLIMAFILIGNEFGAKTVYTAMILGPLTQMLDRIYPYTNLTHHVLSPSADNYQAILSALRSGTGYQDSFGNDYMLSRAGEVLEPIRSSVMAGGLQQGDVWFDLLCFVLLLSACQAFMFRINASTGGLDILAKIINKYVHYDIGKSVSIAGAVICCSAFLINDFRMVVIGLIGTWINGLAVDYFTASLNKRKRVCIVSVISSRTWCVAARSMTSRAAIAVRCMSRSRPCSPRTSSRRSWPLSATTRSRPSSPPATAPRSTASGSVIRRRTARPSSSTTKKSTFDFRLFIGVPGGTFRLLTFDF